MHLGHSCHAVLLELYDFMIKGRFSIKVYIRLQKLNVWSNSFIIYLDLWQESEEDGKLDYVRKRFFKFIFLFLHLPLFYRTVAVRQRGIILGHVPGWDSNLHFQIHFESFVLYDHSSFKYNLGPCLFCWFPY